MTDKRVGSLEEKPVPLSHGETLEEFNKALHKAQMIYKRIDRSDKYQYAMLINEESESRVHNGVMMFTSSIDKKVHTRKLKHHVSKYHTEEFKENYKRIVNPETNREGLMYFTGCTVIEPTWQHILAVGSTCVFGCQYPIIKDPWKLYSYDGAERLAGEGCINIQHFTNDDYSLKLRIRNGRVNEEVPVLFNIYGDKNEWDERINLAFRKMEVFILFRNSIYKIYDGIGALGLFTGVREDEDTGETYVSIPTKEWDTSHFDREWLETHQQVPVKPKILKLTPERILDRIRTARQKRGLYDI